MADEFNVYGVDDLHAISGYTHDHFQNGGKPLRFVVTQKSNGTIPMLKVWRMWMVDIAKYQADRGAEIPIQAPYSLPNGDIGMKVIGSRPYDEKDAHEAYTYLCLGCDERGVRYSWAVNSDKYKDRVSADIGRKLRAMQKFHEHCIEHSIPIRIPDNNEYSNLMEKQNE